MERVLDLPVFMSPTTIHYPESDGTPMGETGFHVNVMLYLKQVLGQLFYQSEGVYVAANMFFYYEEGNPSAVAAPDVFVVKGVDKAERRTYKLWEEGVVPCAIFEITSRSTRREDLRDKRALYERLGVREYYLFDPLDEYLSPRLQGFRLQRGRYWPLAPSADGTLFSQELNVLMRAEDRLLRLLDPASGEKHPTYVETFELVSAITKRAEAEAERAEAEAERAEAEAERANVAEAKAAQLQAELQGLRRQAK